MFSGIVETIGTITQLSHQDGCAHFAISPQQHLNDLAIGHSIAINGVCLTVTKIEDEVFFVSAVPETLRLTNLDQLQINSHVNLERALSANARIGGHYVQGHVDCEGIITQIQPDNNSSAWLVRIHLPSTFSRYLIRKGFITIDGMSITIIDTGPDWFTVTLIPHTQAVTISQGYSLATKLNIEIDMMGKYIEKLMGAYQHASTN